MFEFVCKFDHIDGKSWSDDYNEYKDSFIKKEMNWSYIQQ